MKYLIIAGADRASLELLMQSLHLGAPESRDAYIVFPAPKETANLEELIFTVSLDFNQEIRAYLTPELDAPGLETFLELIAGDERKGFVSLQRIISEARPEELPVLARLTFKFVRDPRLEYFLKSFFDANLNVSQAAKITGYHRNTINYKLNSFSETTTLNLQNFYDALAANRLIESPDY